MKKITVKFSDNFLNFLTPADNPPRGHDVVNFSEANPSLPASIFLAEFLAYAVFPTSTDVTSDELKN